MMGWQGYSGFDWTAIVFVVALVGVLFWALRSSLGEHSGARGDTTSPEQSALEIAKERYARGEMSREEFLDVTNDLYLANADFKQKHKHKRSES
jgi:putative membrane protein